MNERPARRRGLELERAIFAAVLGQLAEVGYAGLTIDGVAAAARTGKAALYRRWVDKDGLVLSALRSALPAASDVTLTGDVRGDLLAVLRFLRDGIAATHGSAFQVVKADGRDRNGSVQDLFRDQVSGPGRALIEQILVDGAAAGRVRPGVGPLIPEVGIALLIHRTINAGPRIPDAYLAAVVDEVILPAVTVR